MYQVVHILVEGEIHDLLAALRGCMHEDTSHCRFTASRRTHQQITRAAMQAAARQRVQVSVAAREDSALELSREFRCNQAREDRDTAVPDRIIVIAFAESRAAQLGDR